MIRKVLSNRDKEFIRYCAKKQNIRTTEIRKFYEIIRSDLWSWNQELNRPKRSSQYNLSGLLSLDVKLGGVPSGAWTEIYGNSQTYKTTIGLFIASRFNASLFINSDNKHIPFRDIRDSNSITEIAGSIRTNEIVKDVINYNMTDCIIIDTLTSLHRGVNTLQSSIKAMAGNSEIVCIFLQQTRNYGMHKLSSQGSEVIHSLNAMQIAIKERKDGVFGSIVTCKIEKPNLPPSESYFVILFNRNGIPDNRLFLIEYYMSQEIVERIGRKVRFTDSGKELTEEDYQNLLVNYLKNSDKIKYENRKKQDYINFYLSNNLERLTI